MWKPRFALPLALLLPLATGAAAAVDSFDSVGDFSRAIGMKAGGWHVTMKAVSARVEGGPHADPAALAALKAEIEPQVGTVEEVDDCFDPASLDAVRLPGILVERDCSYKRLEAGDGRWAMTATCPTPRKDGTVTFTGEGTYSPELVTGRHEARIPIRGLVAHVAAETVSRFVGDCRSRPLIITPAPETD